jgi:hypothetical protein
VLAARNTQVNVNVNEAWEAEGGHLAPLSKGERRKEKGNGTVNNGVLAEVATGIKRGEPLAGSPLRETGEPPPM